MIISFRFLFLISFKWSTKYYLELLRNEIIKACSRRVKSLFILKSKNNIEKKILDFWIKKFLVNLISDMNLLDRKRKIEQLRKCKNLNVGCETSTCEFYFWRALLAKLLTPKNTLHFSSFILFHI